MGTARAAVCAALLLAGCGKPIPPELALPPAESPANEPEVRETVAVTAVATPSGPSRPLAYAAWLEAQAAMEHPPVRFGGPLTIELSHAGGGLYAFRPDDGGADPRAPSSDRFFTMYDARVSARIIDRTPFDARGSRDEALIEASWRDGRGTTYGVRCCSELGGADRRHPTFGGVLTNHLVHGATGIGSDMLPTTWAWVAVWGIGELLVDGQVVESGVPVRLMVTERTRDDDLRRVADGKIDPTQRQLELVVEPLRRGEQGWTPSALNTGYASSDGPLPYWHVLFPHFRVRWTEGD